MRSLTLLTKGDVVRNLLTTVKIFPSNVTALPASGSCEHPGPISFPVFLDKPRQSRDSLLARSPAWSLRPSGSSLNETPPRFRLSVLTAATRELGKASSSGSVPRACSESFPHRTHVPRICIISLSPLSSVPQSFTVALYPLPASSSRRPPSNEQPALETSPLPLCSFFR